MKATDGRAASDYTMSISIVNDVHIEIRRLAVAGSDVAIWDSRIKRLALDIRKTGETIPVFVQLADSIEPLVNSGADGDMAGKLLKAATLTNASLYTQGVVGVEGELTIPNNSDLVLPTAASYQTISLVKEMMGERGGRLQDLFENALLMMEKDHTGLPVDREMNKNSWKNACPTARYIRPSILTRPACTWR
ncbi:MAG TPA: hypothetical protein VK436_13940 [Methanocella sp.]|nr:hypothetical protein [Methanocella sp.]